MRADPGSEYEYRGALTTVRSDGTQERTLIDEGVTAFDLGPGGVVHAAQEEEAIGSGPPSSSLVTLGIVKPVIEGDVETYTYYYGVAASSDGRVAASRAVTKRQEVPPFLSDGMGVLRSTTVPVLVPPEEPPGTGGLVPSAEEESFQLLFTNDPAGELAHVEQVNVFVSGTSGEPEPIPDPQAQQVSVRGTQGQFFCGASTCFLSWHELDTNYTVGEFGANGEAIAFAESLVPIETVAGSGWREGTSESMPTPELIVRERDGSEQVLESVTGFCECGFRPLDWSHENDRLLVLASAEGYTLQEYRADALGEPWTLVAGVVDPTGVDVILDAAYGPDGVVALFGGEGGPPGTLRPLDGGDVSNVRAFDMEGSTLAYVSEAGDVIVRDLSTGNELTVGEGAIDVSVAPDLIAGSGSSRTDANRGDGRLPGVILVVIGLAGVALLAGAALLLIARRRGLD